MKKIIFRVRSQICSKIGSNDQKFSADSKNIYIIVLCDIGCHRMTSHVRKHIDMHVFGISTEFLII